jgi:DNA-binding transcriptional LysR family regulator
MVAAGASGDRRKMTQSGIAMPARTRMDRSWRMNLMDLRYLAAAADARSFAQASRMLGRNASTLSRRICRLEDELGLTLFERERVGLRLTSGGRAVMVYVHRLLADFESVCKAGRCSGSGEVGELHVGVRMPPVGEPLRSLLLAWRRYHPNVHLKLHELNEREILAGLAEHHLDAALVPQHSLWPNAISVPLYRERIVLAVNAEHPLSSQLSVKWSDMRDETFLVQGWEESQTAREFFASFLGSGTHFHAHSASKQSIFALVAAGFGVTLATESQSEAIFPGVVYRLIAEDNAGVTVALTWKAAREDAVVGRFVAFLRDNVQSCLPVGLP